MEFKILVISNFIVPDKESSVVKTRYDYYDCLNDALDGIRSFDYPPHKISIHTLTH